MRLAADDEMGQHHVDNAVRQSQICDATESQGNMLPTARNIHALCIDHEPSCNIEALRRTKPPLPLYGLHAASVGKDVRCK
jgi:hypothetical protein